MEKLSELLQEEMLDNTVFTIPIGKGIGISESTVVSWIVMAVIILLCIILGSNLKVRNISRRQAAAEFIVTKLETMIVGFTGEGGRPYALYLFTVLLYIGLSNIIGIFGFKPPTKSLVVTASLAVMSIILVQVASIRARTAKGWLHSFIEPVPVVLPFNILDLITRPLSLCMRLFGNVLGAFVIMELLNTVTKVFVPAVFSLYFDLFDGLLQAYVFVCLTGRYISEATEIAEK
ncbi:MAG: F0F1 ATP synthase subunit A [Oscillospiraceae bacterium]|nr:F0F1 ATP synthase subunit A [Oscillospiraceae bacterium]